MKTRVDYALASTRLHQIASLNPKGISASQNPHERALGSLIPNPHSSALVWAFGPPPASAAVHLLASRNALRSRPWLLGRSPPRGTAQAAGGPADACAAPPIDPPQKLHGARRWEGPLFCWYERKNPLLRAVMCKINLWSPSGGFGFITPSRCGRCRYLCPGCVQIGVRKDRTPSVRRCA